MWLLRVAPDAVYVASVGVILLRRMLPFARVSKQSNIPRLWSTKIEWPGGGESASHNNSSDLGFWKRNASVGFNDKRPKKMT